MIYLTDAERIELNCAELSAQCGTIHIFPSDPWYVGITEWVIFCGKVMQYNKEYGWSHGCTPGKMIGSKIKTSYGVRKLLASRVNWFDN